MKMIDNGDCTHLDVFCWCYCSFGFVAFGNGSAILALVIVVVVVPSSCGGGGAGGIILVYLVSDGEFAGSISDGSC
ncbi:Hypothetical predicted protein [Octopus vulgaris]|uniref:Uncharacterized protein n=1 Tax=Octopus vulgaris TaxID=6645 RepID=A0AA36AV36_OCTVU|nr:Hypothetical predicted protein [Octopus vulgaris]